MSFINNILERVGLVKISDVRNIKDSLVNGGSMNSVLDIFGDRFTDAGYQYLIEQYRSWVYTCVDKIAKTVASLPLNLYTYQKEGKYIDGMQVKQYIKHNVDKGEGRLYLKQQHIDKVKVENHPLYELLNRPNKISTRFTLWYDTMVKMELTGKCGWYIPRNGLRIPAEIWALPMYKTYDLTAIPDSKEVLKGYRYTNGQNTTFFDPDEIIFMRYPNPENPFKGMSPLIAQSYPYDIENYLMQQQYKLYKNKTLPGVIFTTDKQISADKISTFVQHINNEFKGASKAGKPMVLHSGLKIDKPVGMTAKELMLEEISEFTRDKLLSGFGMPAGKLGLVKDVNRANMEALDKTYYQETIKPRSMLIEEYLENFLLPIYDDRLTADFDLPSNEDREIVLRERIDNLQSGYTTINEERNRSGLEPVDWGDRPWLPFNVIQPGQKKGDAPDKDSEKSSGIIETKSVNDDIIWKQFVGLQEEYEIPLKQAMQGYFSDVKSEIMAKFEKLAARKSGQLNGWSKKKRDEWIKKDNLDDMNIDISEEIAVLKELAGPYIREIMLKSGQNRLNSLSTVKMQSEFTFAILPDSEAEKWLGDRLEMFSKEVAGTTFDDIDDILIAGFSEGLPITTISETLADKFASYDKYRAGLIARTETVAAMSRADVDAVKQSGMKDEFEKYWIPSRDASVRDSHKIAGEVYNEGNAIPIDDEFAVGADSMIAPGNGSIAGENINCRCTIGYKRKEG